MDELVGDGPDRGDRRGEAGGPAPMGSASIGISDAQLTALALAAPPGDSVDADAIPLSVYLGTLARTGGLLPQWYMPEPMARRARGWRLPVVLVIVAAFVTIEALGLCSVFGQITVG